MPLIGWVDPDTITTDEWSDVARIDQGTRDRLLASAHEQLDKYAPALPDPVPPDPQVIPQRYRLAQILQAQENWAATRREGDVLGFAEAGYAITVRPLSTAVKSLLRPRTGVPRVG